MNLFAIHFKATSNAYSDSDDFKLVMFLFTVDFLSCDLWILFPFVLSIVSYSQLFLLSRILR